MGTAGTPDPDDRELFEHLVAEFGDRGREAVEFLESARDLLEGHEELDPIPRRANDVAYNIREALNRLLPPDSGSGKWRKITEEVVKAKRRYAALRGLEGTDEARALDDLIAALEQLEAFKASEEGLHRRRLQQVLENRAGVPPLEVNMKSYLELRGQVDQQGVHGSPSIEEVRDYLERATSRIWTLFAPFQLRKPELDVVARLDDPTPQDAERLLALCSTSHHLAYFLQHAVSPKWLRLLDPHLDPRPGGGAWPALYLTERLGPKHSEEIAVWLAERYGQTGPTDVSAGYIAAAAVDCMPASAGILLRALREYPRSRGIRANAIRAAKAVERESPILEQLAKLLLDPRDEVTLDGRLARRLIDTLVAGMTQENADARVSLLCERLTAASRNHYLLFTLLPTGSIEDVPEDETRGTGVLVRGLMQVVAHGLQLGMSVERIFGLADGLPEGLRHRFRAWLLRQAVDVSVNVLVNEIAQAILDREPTGDDVRLIDRIVRAVKPADFEGPWADALGRPPPPEEVGRALSSNDVPRKWKRAKYWYPVLPETARRAWDTASRLMDPTYPTASREEYLAPMPRPRAGYYAGSPMAQQDLEALGVEDAARRIADWRPTGDRMIIARELGRTLEAIVAAHPQKWADRSLETIALLRHPTYIHHYFEGLAKAGAALAGMGPQLVETIAFCRTHPWDVIPLGGDDFDYDPTWIPVDDSSVRLIAALAEHGIDLGDRYDDAWRIVLEAARDRGRDSSIVSPREDPLETAINRACTKALEAAFHLMSADFKKHGEVRRDAFELLDESLRLEGWDGAEHRAIIAPRVPFLLHVARAWVESNEQLLFGSAAPDDLGQRTIELALKWGRPNSWLLERQRRAVRKAARNKVEHALDHMLVAMLRELPGYGVDETARWLASQDSQLLSDSGEPIARLLMREPAVGHLDLGRRFWETAIDLAQTPDSLKGFGWWAEVESLSKEDFERLTFATVEKTEGTLDWCVEVAARCAREPLTTSGLEVITRLLRGRHEPWDRSQVADVALAALKATSEHAHLKEARRRLRDVLTDLGRFEAQDL